MADPGRYGIRIIHESWATVDGGPDVVGSREQMDALAAKWDKDPRSSHGPLVFKVEPYTGDDAAESSEVLDLIARNGVDGGY